MDEILSSRAVLESANNPKINHGGQSSSQALNTINENLRTDLLALDADVANVEAALNTNKALLSCQASATGSAASRLEALLTEIKQNLVDENGKVPVDLFDDRYKTANNTATVDTTFGQATLAITGQSEWLVAKDLEGNTWVPKGSKLLYAIRTDTTEPADMEFKEDPEFIRAIDGDPGTMWVRPLSKVGGLYAGQHLWIKILVPTDVIPNGAANTLIFRPFPSLCHDLVSVSVTSPSGSPYKISEALLKYLPGYDAGSKNVKNLADVRLFYPPTNVTSILCHFITGEFQYWGFSEIALRTTNFQATSILEFDLSSIKPGESTKNLSTVTLRGDNEVYLGQIPANIANNKVTYNLTQQGSGYTPVITLLDTKWV